MDGGHSFRPPSLSGYCVCDIANGNGVAEELDGNHLVSGRWPCVCGGCVCVCISKREFVWLEQTVCVCVCGRKGLIVCVYACVGV